LRREVAPAADAIKADPSRPIGCGRVRLSKRRDLQTRQPKPPRQKPLTDVLSKFAAFSPDLADAIQASRVGRDSTTEDEFRE
jgi:hypothetical protein